MATRAFLQSRFLPETAVIELDDNAPASAVKATCLAALPNDVNRDHLEVFDEHEALRELKPEDQEKQPNKSKRLHVGRCTKVEVTVRYAGQSAQRKFSPATPIGTVKSWAARQFGIQPRDAAELSLQLAGSDVQPAIDKHAGCFADDHCRVTFDLVRSYTVNG
jgi:ATP-dependent Clp protease ATP-binding subunit ClpA